MPKSPQQQQLHGLQDAFNQVCMNMDQDMYGGNYSKEAGQSNLDFWNTGSPSSQPPLPSGPEILQDFLKAS